MAPSIGGDPAAPTDTAASQSAPDGSSTAAIDGAQKSKTSVIASSGKQENGVANGETKASGAEAKKRAKAEKAAKREREKAERAGAGGIAAGLQASEQGGQSSGALKPTQNQQKGQKDRQGEAKAQAQAQTSSKDAKASHKRTGSVSAANAQRPLALRRRPSQSGGQAKESKQIVKEVGLFGHLYNQPRRYTIEGASKAVHPAVLALGLQMSSYTICGSSARCVAMLLAFKKAIEAYSTPKETSLPRHMSSHYLSPQIDFLKTCRPISVSMGNAIRWLKDQIIHIDPDTDDHEAKAELCAGIDQFIRERITVAGSAIAASASTKIKPGDVILTYAKSALVEQTLLRAHEAGTDFRVIVLDSRPLFEGKNLARALARAGLRVQYMLLSAAPHAAKEATTVLLGAHAMMSNGRLCSRVGTAVVAMLAHARAIPVIVCCESVKFTDRVALDSIVQNEIAPSEELLLPSAAAGVADGGSLAKWKETPGLQLLNIMYDVTPAEYIDMVVTEFGFLPPSSVPVVHRISTERDVRT
ncbi:hypothetical protein LTR50_001251 [Elasticomyces elasticus]|nr:hypothetical protein LTR50_001251 [Elasticomyces elasticus]